MLLYVRSCSPISYKYSVLKFSDLWNNCQKLLAEVYSKGGSTGVCMFHYTRIVLIYIMLLILPLRSALGTVFGNYLTFVKMLDMTRRSNDVFFSNCEDSAKLSRVLNQLWISNYELVLLCIIYQYCYYELVTLIWPELLSPYLILCRHGGAPVKWGHHVNLLSYFDDRDKMTFALLAEIRIVN